MSDCGLLSCALIERVNKGLQSPKQGMVRRKNSPLYGSFLHRRNSIRKALSHIAHKRRNVRFEGLRRVHTCLRQQDRTQRLTGRNTGRFGWGRYHYPRSVLRGSETLRGRVSERHTLPLLGLGRGRSRRTQRACGTAMRLCASLSRGAAGPQARAAPLLYLASHRWVPRFFRSQQQDAEKHICCFTRWSAPCVLPLAAAPLLCPQHPSAADKIPRWKTGSAE